MAVSGWYIATSIVVGGLGVLRTLGQLTMILRMLLLLLLRILLDGLVVRSIPHVIYQQRRDAKEIIVDGGGILLLLQLPMMNSLRCVRVSNRTRILWLWW